MLYNANHDPVTATLDLTKPIWFCDVDGVLNTLPFENQWIKEEESSLEARLSELWNPANWTTVQLQPNIKTHFATTETSVQINRLADFAYIEEDKREDWQTLRIRHSPTLVQRIRRLIESDQLNFVWLTSWQSEACRILNPLLGFSDTPFMMFDKSTQGTDIMKYNAILDFFDEYKCDVPWVWVDDSATQFLMNSRARKHLNKLVPAKTNLILKTDSRWGISRSQILRIEKFIHENKG